MYACTHVRRKAKSAQASADWSVAQNARALTMKSHVVMQFRLAMLGVLFMIIQVPIASIACCACSVWRAAVVQTDARAHSHRS
jgi:hypothetical protein